MNIIEEGERYEQEVEVLVSVLFWIERLFLFLLLVSSELCTDLIGLLLVLSTLLASIFFVLCPKLFSAGPSGISGFWLFLSDRFMFLLALKSFEAENNFLWPLSVFLFIANNSIYIIEYLLRSSKPHKDEILISTGSDDETDDIGDVNEEVQKIRELLNELREDEKKMDIEVEFLEHIINSGLETHRKILSLKLLELREELRDDGEKMKTYRELMKSFVYSELVTLKDHLRLNIDEIWEDVQVDKDIKTWRDDVKFVAEEVCENYLVILETANS